MPFTSSGGKSKLFEPSAPVPGEPEFVAVDTGIYWAGVYLELPLERHLASQIVQLAREGRFHVVVLPRVIREYFQIARREGVEIEAREKLQRFFVECRAEPIYESPLPESVIEAAQGRYVSILTHDKDGPIAVEVAHCRPDYFIHSNPDHWSGALDRVLGTRVVDCHAFLTDHGVEPAAKRGRRRRKGPRPVEGNAH
jgi:hypothetical protein